MALSFATTTPIAQAQGGIFTATLLRTGMLAIIAAAVIAGLLATGTQATHVAILQDGAALTRLMRFMAALKAVMVMAASAAVLWRLGAAISLPGFVAYAGTCALMAAGPGLIWGMAHVGLGALLLHGGLLATILLIWFDPAVNAKLAGLVATRR
jgi:hypothetical protein